MKALKYTVLALVGAFVLVMAIGLLSEPPTAEERAAAEASSNESQPPESEADEVAQHVIPGLNPVDVYLNLEQRGFTVTKDFSGGSAIWTCAQKWPSVDLTADVIGSSATEVTMVRAMVMADGVEKTALAGRDFVAMVASVPYDGAQPQVARDWVVSNYDQDSSTTTIGGARFTLRAPSDLYRMLLIEPVK